MLFNKLSKIGFIKVKLVLLAGSATTGPPVSTVLGQYRVDMVQFSKSFNDKTKYFEKGSLIPVRILLKVGGNINYDILTTSVSYLVKRAVIVLLLAKQRRLSALIMYKILLIKMQKSSLPDRAFFRSLLGSIKSMQLNKYHFNC